MQVCGKCIFPKSSLFVGLMMKWSATHLIVQVANCDVQVALGSNLENGILFKNVLCLLLVQLVDIFLQPVALYFTKARLIFLLL